MADIIFCSAAEMEYTESLCWYAERSVEAAHDFDAELDWAIHQIAKSPERFPQCDERHRFYLMRRFPFQIIYRTQGDVVIVVAVAHTSRVPDYWSGR